MTIARDRFRDAFTWDEWLEGRGEDRDEWERRYRETQLGEQRAAFEALPTPRYVACLLDGTAAGSLTVLPWIAKACAQAGVAGGVELRIFPAEENADLLAQFRGGDAGDRGPICVVFDEDWVQIGIVRGMPPGVQEPSSVLDRLRTALEGDPVPPWLARRETTEHRWKQAKRAGEEK